MDLETQERHRVEAVKAAFDSMVAIMQDSKAENVDKIKAAAIIDSFSDTIVKAHLSTQADQTMERTGSKLMRQLDKLSKDHDHDHGE